MKYTLEDFDYFLEYFEEERNNITFDKFISICDNYQKNREKWIKENPDVETIPFTEWTNFETDERAFARDQYLFETNRPILGGIVWSEGDSKWWGVEQLLKISKKRKFTKISDSPSSLFQEPEEKKTKFKTFEEIDEHYGVFIKGNEYDIEKYTCDNLLFRKDMVYPKYKEMIKKNMERLIFEEEGDLLFWFKETVEKAKKQAKKNEKLLEELDEIKKEIVLFYGEEIWKIFTTKFGHKKRETEDPKGYEQNFEERMWFLSFAMNTNFNRDEEKYLCEIIKELLHENVQADEMIEKVDPFFDKIIEIEKKLL